MAFFFDVNYALLFGATMIIFFTDNPRTNVILGESEVTIEWEVPEDTVNGTYRIMHQGYHKDLLGKYFYSGYTNNLQVATGIILDKSDIVEPRQSFLERLVSFFVEPINVFVN